MVKTIIRIYSKIIRYIFYLIFCFDKWHLSILSDRPYAMDIILYLNAKPEEFRTNLLEIGCGLGDILQNVKFTRKQGFDSEKNVISAASLISIIQLKTDIQYKMFSFPGDEIKDKYDCIVMVNWVHHIHPDILKRKVCQYLNKHLLPNGEIIIDTVQNKSYEYNHSIAYLTENLNCKVIKIGSYENQREIFAIQRVE